MTRRPLRTTWSSARIARRQPQRCILWYRAELRGLASAPCRRALLEEGAHAFLGVVGARVHCHDGLGEVVGAVLVELDLGVESLFADPDRERARARDGVDDDGDLVFQLLGWHDAVDEAPVQRGGGIDRPAG